MGVQTDEKKQHFDDIYVERTPVPYKIRILDALEYISDDFNKREFDRLVLPWAQEQNRKLNFVDLCACFGNTTMATLYGMGYDEICANWADEESCRTIQKGRRFDARTTAIDISVPALEYGQTVGLYDATIAADLNNPPGDVKAQINKAMSEAQILISTAALVYLEPAALESLVTSFAKGDGEGYALVNFLNPFALEKADATKRLLLEHLDFVGSSATRHRRLSELERNNYPEFGDWSLLEIWVLKRKTPK